jgi:hypothetical protein
MAKLLIHNQEIDLKKERVKRHREKSAEQRFNELMKLNHFALLMSGRKSLKAPQGKGIILRKNKNNDNSSLL